MSTDKGLSEVNRHRHAAKDELKKLAIAETPVDLEKCWEAFLSSFSKSLGKTISYADQFPKTKANAWKIKNASIKDDEGLVFLREARNVAEHGLEAIAEYNSGHTSLFGNAIGLGPNCLNVVIENCLLNDRMVARLVCSTDSGGRLLIHETSDPVFLEFIPADIRLKSVCSIEKKREFTVPKKLGEVALVRGTALELGLTGEQWLSDKFDEIRDLLA